MSFTAKITADIKGFQDGIAKATKDIDDFGKRVSDRLKTVGDRFTDLGKKAAGFSAAAAAVGAAVVKVANDAGKMAGGLKNAAIQFDTTTEALQEWQLVAVRAGARTDTFADATERLTRRLKDVDGEADKTGALIRSLGVEVNDTSGNLRRAGDISADVIEALAGVSNVTERNIMATQLFGRGWSRVALILNQGADSIAKTRKEAHDLGLVLSDEALNAADSWTTAMSEVRLRLQAVTGELGAKLAPVLTNTVIPAIEDKVIPAIKRLVDFFSALSPQVQRTTIMVTSFVAGITPVALAVGAAISAIGVAFSALVSPIGLAVAAVAGLGAAFIYVRDNWEALKERMSDWGWWRNSLLSVAQFMLEWSPIKILIDQFNRLMEYFGKTGISNPFDTLIAGLEELKTETKEYEREFGTFGEALRNAVKDWTGVDLASAFNATAAGVDNMSASMSAAVPPVHEVIDNLDELDALINDFDPQIDWEPMVNDFERVAQMIGQTVDSLIGGMASGLAAAIGTGKNVISTLATTLLDGLGDLAIRIGVITMGIGETLTALFAAMANPFGAIAGGAALIALGVAMKAAAAAIGSAGRGFNISGAGVQPVPTTQNFNPTSQSQLRGAYTDAPYEVVFKIEGDTLVGVLDAQTARARRL